METNLTAESVESSVECASPQMILIDVPRVPANPDPTALSGPQQLWFDMLANKIAESKAKINDALYEMGRQLITAKDTLRCGEWLKFLGDARVGLSERDAQRMMKIARQADGRRLAALGISKATILLESLRKPEDRQSFIDHHGDLAQITERDLRAMVKGPARRKPPKPVTAVETTESLPPQIGELRERILGMTAYEAEDILYNVPLYGKRFTDLPGWAKFLVLGMFIATPSALKAAQYLGPLQMTLDVSSEAAIDSALQKMMKATREWLLAGIESQENVVDWWNQTMRFGILPH